MEKERTYDVYDLINAEINLEPLECLHCGDTQEVTFYGNMGDAHCALCGKWQLDH